MYNVHGYGFSLTTAPRAGIDHVSAGSGNHHAIGLVSLVQWRDVVRAFTGVVIAPIRIGTCLCISAALRERVLRLWSEVWNGRDGWRVRDHSRHFSRHRASAAYTSVPEAPCSAPEMLSSALLPPRRNVSHAWGTLFPPEASPTTPFVGPPYLPASLSGDLAVGIFLWHSPYPSLFETLVEICVR